MNKAAGNQTTCLKYNMGNFFSAGAVAKIEIMVRNGDKTLHFTDIRIEAAGGENKQLADLMLQLDGPSDKLEIVYFKLSQDNAHVYVPSEEKLIALIGTIDAYRTKIRKGWTAPEPAEGREKIHINALIIDVKLDEKSKELAAKMMMMHIALVMAKFNMHCDESSLMGNMVEFKTLFGGLNQMVDLLK
jgi:hypothetical protein